VNLWAPRPCTSACVLLSPSPARRMGCDGALHMSVSVFDTVFTRRQSICISKFTACGFIVYAMNSFILHARQMSLALLVVAVVDHGHMQTDYSGSTPQSWGLLRLGRDIMRRAGCDSDAQGVESAGGGDGGASTSAGVVPVSA
jgi:hypothetical protein